MSNVIQIGGQIDESGKINLKIFFLNIMLYTIMMAINILQNTNLL